MHSVKNEEEEEKEETPTTKHRLRDVHGDQVSSKHSRIVEVATSRNIL